MPGAQSEPQFLDGASSVSTTYVTCLNDSNLVLLYAGDGITEGAVHNAHAMPSGEGLGSHTQATGIYEGPLNLQLANPDDVLRPGYVLAHGSRYYVITGPIGEKREKSKVVMIAPPVRSVLNPIVSSLLSTLGQAKAATVAGADGTVANAVVNTRAGATGAWALSAWSDEYTSATVPAEITINASSGLITCASAGAGTYYLKVTYTETLTGKPTRKGVGFLILTCTA
jgi:hypothetical protein